MARFNNINDDQVVTPAVELQAPAIEKPTIMGKHAVVKYPSGIHYACAVVGDSTATGTIVLFIEGGQIETTWGKACRIAAILNEK